VTPTDSYVFKGKNSVKEEEKFFNEPRSVWSAGEKNLTGKTGIQKS